MFWGNVSASTVKPIFAQNLRLLHCDYYILKYSKKRVNK